MINRELVIGFLALTVAFFMLVRSEYNTWAASKREIVEVHIDREQAEKQVQLKFDREVTISFEQELRDKYYFKVNDPKTDSTYDVYVNKDHPRVQMLHKANRSSAKF